MPTTPMGAEKVLHGHLPAADASTGSCCCASTRRSPRRATRGPGTSSRRWTCSGCRWCRSRPRRRWPRAAALLAGALALQLLTLEVAHAHGTNPDLIRREQDPYRALPRRARWADHQL